MKRLTIDDIVELNRKGELTAEQLAEGIGNSQLSDQDTPEKVALVRLNTANQEYERGISIDPDHESLKGHARYLLGGLERSVRMSLNDLGHPTELWRTSRETHAERDSDRVHAEEQFVSVLRGIDTCRRALEDGRISHALVYLVELATELGAALSYANDDLLTEVNPLRKGRSKGRETQRSGQHGETQEILKMDEALCRQDPTHNRNKSERARRIIEECAKRGWPDFNKSADTIRRLLPDRP